MEDASQFRQNQMDGQMQTLVLALKVCPVCESLTRIEANHCAMCNWQGQFNMDVTTVTENLAGLLEKCPELLHTLAPTATPSFLTKLREVLKREIKIRKRLDLSA